MPVVPSWEIKDTQLYQLAETGHSIWAVGQVADGPVFDGLIALHGPVRS